jgi:preprotein translocase subunit SecE
MNRLLTYLRDTRGEIKHVSWPTQKQIIIYTILVIVVSLVTAIYLGLLDFLYQKGLSMILK